MLTYNYHLAGGIKSIIDPYDNEVKYTADKTGRTTAIGDGSSTTAYASAMAYRAFGGIKAMSLSTTSPVAINMTYDSALRLTGYVADSAANNDPIYDAEYSYYNDGMMSSLNNEADGKFDQLNKYDLAGRMKVNDVGNATEGFPFKQVLGYDAFSNLTSRSTFTWQFSERYFNAWYANNRKTTGGSTDYLDYAGNITQSQTANVHSTYWNFDAAGRTARWEERVSYGDNTWKGGETVYDGDGRAVKVADLTRIRIQGIWYDWDVQNSYFIYSSVTGQKVTELTTTGEQAQTFVYMGGTKIARFDSQGVAFHVTDPMTGSEQQTATGSVDPESEQRIELAGLGTAVPVTDPPSMPPPDPPSGGWVGSPENGCTFVEASNSPIPCSDFDFPIREKPKKPKKKEALGIVLPRTAPMLPFAAPGKGPSMGFAASTAFGDEPEPEPEPIGPVDPCPWDDDGKKDCAVTVLPEFEWLNGGSGRSVDDDRKLNTRELDDLLADVKLILSTPSCSEIIAGILAKAATKSNPVREGGVLATFEAIRRQGGISIDSALIAKGYGGLAKGNLANGSGSIALRPRNFELLSGSATAKANFKRTQQLMRAADVIGEIVHHSGANRPYNDQQMANATADYLMKARPDFGPLTDENVLSYSNAWHPTVDGRCPIASLVK